MDDRESSDGNLTDLQDALLVATLPNVLFDGWTDHALRTAATAVGIDPAMVLHAFPEGAAGLAAHFPAWVDRQMAAAYTAEDTATLGLTRRVALAIRLRLQGLEPHREAVRSWLAWLALPGHGTLAPRLLYQSVDAIWYTVGDSATDFSFYTKRAMLAGVYGATLLHWLGDESEQRAATWDFLDRALAGVTGFGRTVAKANQLDQVLNLLPSPARFGRLLRRRAGGRG